MTITRPSAGSLPQWIGAVIATITAIGLLIAMSGDAKYATAEDQRSNEHRLTVLESKIEGLEGVREALSELSISFHRLAATIEAKEAKR